MNHMPFWTAAGGLLVSSVSLLAQSQLASDPLQLPRGVFVENTGQWPETQAQYRLLGTSLAAELGCGTVSFRSGAQAGTQAGAPCTMHFGDALPNGERPVGAVNLYCDADRARWRTGATAWAAVRYREVAAGVDLVVQLTEAGLRYDLELRAGARPEQLAIELEGCRGLSIDGGELVVATKGGDVRQSSPIAWQDGPSGRTQVDCTFRLLGDDRYGFEVAGLDATLPTTIDPTLQATYASYFLDAIWDVQVDAATGDILVCGQSYTGVPSPSNPGAVQTIGDPTAASGNSVAWLARIAPAASPSLVYLTLIGGNGSDLLTAVALDGATVWAAGVTSSTDFPVTMGPPSPTGALGRDALALQFDAATGGLQTATLLGLNDALGYGVVVGGGKVFVHGQGATSPLLPTIGSPAGDSAFVVSIDPATGIPTGGVQIGGDGNEHTIFNALAIDPGVAVYVGGLTTSGTSFPATAGAFAVPLPSGRRNSAPQPVDGWIARLDWSLTGLSYATRIGGTDQDRINALAVSQGKLYFCGSVTNSSILPQPVGGDTSFAGGTGLYGDAIVGVFDFNGYVPGSTPPVPFLSLFGGGAEEDARDILVDGSGRIHFAGMARDAGGKKGGSSTELDNGSGLFKQGLDGGDGFYAVMDPAQSSTLVYSTMIGGSGDEGCQGIARAADGSITVALASFTSVVSAMPTTANAVYPSLQTGLKSWIGRFAAIVP